MTVHLTRIENRTSPGQRPRTYCNREIPEFPVQQPDGSYAPSIRSHILLSQCTCRHCYDAFTGARKRFATIG